MRLLFFLLCVRPCGRVHLTVKATLCLHPKEKCANHVEPQRTTVPVYAPEVWNVLGDCISVVSS